jgi:hypothetical protein
MVPQKIAAYLLNSASMASRLFIVHIHVVNVDIHAIIILYLLGFQCLLIFIIAPAVVDWSIYKWMRLLLSSISNEENAP